jgi:hypothetical protein
MRAVRSAPLISINLVVLLHQTVIRSNSENIWLIINDYKISCWQDKLINKFVDAMTSIIFDFKLESQVFTNLTYYISGFNAIRMFHQHLIEGIQYLLQSTICKRAIHDISLRIDIN